MAPHPRQLGQRRPRIAFLHQLADPDHQILVHDGRAGTRLPIVLRPPLVPQRRAVDAVVGVGDDLEALGDGRRFEGAQDGRQLGALVGLGGAGEGFGDVSVGDVSEVVYREREMRE